MSKGARHALRALWYAARMALIIGAIGVAAFLCFKLAQQASGVYIIATEGMENRAAVVLGDEEMAVLAEYFAPQCIQNDQLLTAGKYSSHYVSGYNYTITVGTVKVLPWSTEAVMEVEEKVTGITGSLADDVKAALAEGETGPEIPLWVNGGYTITLQKDNSGRWYIVDFVQRAAEKAEDEG